MHRNVSTRTGDSDKGRPDPFFREVKFKTVESTQAAPLRHGFDTHSLMSMSQLPLNAACCELSTTVHSARYSVING